MKFQYKVRSAVPSSELEQVLALMGDRGWELVSVHRVREGERLAYQLFFKRGISSELRRSEKIERPGLMPAPEKPVPPEKMSRGGKV